MQIYKENPGKYRSLIRFKRILGQALPILILRDREGDWKKCSTSQNWNENSKKKYLQTIFHHTQRKKQATDIKSFFPTPGGNPIIENLYLKD